jgi:hypothetical protein
VSAGASGALPALSQSGTPVSAGAGGVTSLVLLSQSGAPVSAGASGALPALSQSGTPVSAGAGVVTPLLVLLSQSGTPVSAGASGILVVRSLSQPGEAPDGNSALLGASFDSASQEGSCSAPVDGVASRCVSRSQSGRLLSGCDGAAGSGAGGGVGAGASVPARSLSQEGSCSAPALDGDAGGCVSRSQSGSAACSLVCGGVGTWAGRSIQLGASGADAGVAALESCSQSGKLALDGGPAGVAGALGAAEVARSSAARGRGGSGTSRSQGGRFLFSSDGSRVTEALHYRSR